MLLSHWWKIQSIYVNTVAWVNKKGIGQNKQNSHVFRCKVIFVDLIFDTSEGRPLDEVYQPTMFKNCAASSLTNWAYIMPLILTAIIISIWRPSKFLLFIFLLYIIPYPMQNGWFSSGRASFPWHLSTSSAIITRLKPTHAQRIRNIVRVHVKKEKRKTRPHCIFSEGRYIQCWNEFFFSLSGDVSFLLEEKCFGIFVHWCFVD